MRVVQLVALWCVFLSSPAEAAQPPTLQSRNVTILKTARNAPAGGGVLLAPRLVLTAAHVVHAQIVQVLCGNIADASPEHPVQVIAGVVRAQDATADLALLELITPCNNVTVTEVAGADPAVAFEDVWAVGCPEGYCGRVSKGIVVSYEQGRIITDAKTWFGSSGGGLFTKDGKLVGICSMVHIMSDDGVDSGHSGGFSQVWGVFVPATSIQAFLFDAFAAAGK